MISEHNITFSYRNSGLAIVTLFLLSVVSTPKDAVMFINHLHSPFLDFFFVFMTNFGNGLLIVPAAVLLSFRSLHWSIGIIAAGLVEGLIVTICKRLLFPFANRPITVLDPSEIHVVPGVAIHSVFSFPSGHTVTIFGICTFLALCYKNNTATMLMTLIALLVAISRVYLLQHFPIDITAGAVVGTGIGILGYHWIEQMNKPQWMNQRIDLKRFNKHSKSRLS